MGYIEQNVDPILQIETNIVKAEKKLKELQTEMSNLSIDVHVLQMNLATLKNLEEKK